MDQAPKQRMTQQKKIILEELQKLNTHPTARALCKIVRKRLPKISLGTVYRNLEMMSTQGIIQKLDLSGAEMCFDGNPYNHYHLRCIDCGKVCDVDMDLIKGLEEQIARQSDFEILSHNLEFVGICPECKALRNRITENKQN